MVTEKFVYSSLTFYFIFLDVGADFEMTDSEDETEGLRYITHSMIPPQFNSDQGAFTILPLSQGRLTKDKL